ncbi:MAG TPA: hypothetical protein VM580_01540, partial [Labilithrix sp.]|nr:hypothetical protein [Labilithrix sp.]
MARGHAAAGLALLALAGAASCRRATPEPPAHDDAHLAAEPSGCTAIVRRSAASSDTARARTSCALPSDRKIRVFVPGAGGRVEVVSGGVAVETTRIRPVADGELFAIRVPDGANSVEIRRAPLPGEARQRASCTLLFAPNPRPSWHAEAQALREEGKLDQAAALAEKALDEARPASERAAAEALLARIALRRGKVDEAERRFRAAIRLDDEAGLVSDRADDAFALAFLLHKRTRRYADARRVLDELGSALDD